MHLDWVKLRNTAILQLNKPYRFGAEVDLEDPSPKEFDCSEFIEWAYHQIGLYVPDGAGAQYEASVPIQNTQCGDVGFFLRDCKVYHVGMLLDDKEVIEARGHEPSLEAQGVRTNRILTRPREKWETFPAFSGWHRFKIVMK